MEETKHLLQSKTFWLNALAVLVPLIVPIVQDYVAAHPELATTLIAVLNIVNRIFGTTTAVKVVK